ncbi:MAG: GNAT family N-acetyltransferase [Gaiellaceae bacterium]
MTVFPFPAAGLRVDGLLLRAPSPDDLGVLAPVFGDPEIGGEAGMPPLSEHELRAFTENELPGLRRSGVLVPLVIDGGGEILGGASLHRFDPSRGVIELGYWLFPAARGRGVATRAVRTLAGHAFSAGVQRVEAFVRVENTVSIRVLERAGFTREGRLRSYLPYGDGRSDAHVYSLLPGE